MDVVTLPIISAPQSPATANAGPAVAPNAGPAPGEQSASTAQAGASPATNPFAKLLAKQIHAEVKGATMIAVTDATKIAAEPDAVVAPVDPALLLQAAIFMPVPVQVNVSVGINATAQAAAPIDVSAMLSSGSAADGAKGEAPWQSVAADPAAFAAAGGVATSALATSGDAATSSFDKVLAMKSAQAELPQATALSSQLPSPVGVPVQTTTPQSNAVQASSNIPQTVGHSAWGDMLGDRVVWMVGQQHQGVELHLNPPALGPLEVRLSMSDGQANLSFATQHLPVKEAIEAATSRLREMLGESGISLGSVSVNVGSFTQQQQPDSQSQTKSGRSSWADANPAVDFSATRSSAISLLSRNGMVDVFA